MRRYVIFSFWIVLMYPLGVDLHLTGLPRIAADLNAAESALHIAFSVYLAGMASTMLIAGWCADHIGRRPVALAGAVIFALASVAAGSATTTTFFLIARFVQGVGAGFCYVVTFALLRDVLSGQARAKVLSMMNGITCIAPVLAPVIGFIILLYFHWSVMFYVCAAYALVSIIFCLFFIKETRPEKSLHTDENSSDIKVAKEVFLNTFFLTRLAISCLGMGVILTYVNVSPMILMGQMQFTSGQYSVAMALLAVVSMSISFSMPKIITAFNSRSVLYTALGLFLLNALLLGIFLCGADYVILLLIVFGLCGAGFSLMFGIIMSQALSPFVTRAGMASSVLAISQLSFASAYIWIMAQAGVASVTMLFIILLTTSLAGAILLKRYPDSSNDSSFNE
ncbi:MdtL family multidrug efflux MFS transporter [Morganella psychrotolerans]|uniref:MdtL family multidrug efflux MFS transporter n=1 Tax=Morganella psychrotolerans TaxID=368603 RepID=A0A5M9R642_9GAMM|nr:MdtL family multidrug efflux MFS transporter [Morganella psychrotolerans]KAA8715396.1 MdtL family multidrug efflux MFS transporter [Morganella psychrotolerans]OBU05439.1 multidrug transporter subunit MdtL [Morganella psychrotolerans]